MPDFEIHPRGPFTLSSAARFIAGWPPAAGDPQAEASDEVRLGFLVDDWSGHAGVLLRQREDGTVAATITQSTAAHPERVREQAARVLSLDHDATGYAALGETDPVVGEFAAPVGLAAPGALSLSLRGGLLGGDLGPDAPDRGSADSRPPV